MPPEPKPKQCIERLIEAARVLADAQTKPGRALRQQLLLTTGLSPEGIELGLSHALETQPAHSELAALCAGVPQTEHVWVILSANVFVAPLRAIALALASGGRVHVKPSRRDPVLAEALHAQCPELFELVSTINPVLGQHVYAYGSDETLATIEQSLPTGVRFFAHGSGMGVALVAAGEDLQTVAAALALDLTLFDQRGCLSPRLVVLEAAVPREALAQQLAEQLTESELRYPMGILSQADLGEITWFREVSAYVGSAWLAGRGIVGSFEQAEAVPLPPAKRCISLVSAKDVLSAVKPFEALITAIGTNDPRLADAAQASFPGARISALGRMQRPLFDGPVDRRRLRVT